MSSANDFEKYTLCGAPWEAEALSLFEAKYLEHQGRDIRISHALKERLQQTPPTHLEIGSHRAKFLEGISKANPDAYVLGLEIRPKYSRLAREHIQKKNLTNVLEEKVDAKLAVIIAIPPESLDAVYVNFPDPWWKDRQSHRRLLDIPFLRVLARRLKPRGRLYLKSDVFEYLYTVRRFAEKSEMFRPLAPERWPDESQWTWSSREAKCMRAAIPFGRGYYERLKDADVTIPTVPEAYPEESWDEMLVGIEQIKGPPPIDLEMRRRTALARKREREKVLADEDDADET